MPDRNTKYTGAWLENNARIQARDNVLSGFIVLTSALLGTSLSAKDDRVAFVSVIVGYAALAAALLIRHHDVIIGYLNKFQYEISLDDGSTANGPEWFDPKAGGYYRVALKQRVVRDIAQLLFIIIGGATALAVSRPAIENSPVCKLRPLLWYGSMLCLLLALLIVLRTWWRRGQILHQMEELGVRFTSIPPAPNKPDAQA